MAAPRAAAPPVVPSPPRPLEKLWRIRAEVQYDGATFAGFQRQPDKNTVQGVVEKALRRVVGEHRAVSAASRTDTGVHAHALTLHFDLSAPHLSRISALRGDEPSTSYDGEEDIRAILSFMELRLNIFLFQETHGAVCVRGVRWAPGFNAVTSRGKRYTYRVCWVPPTVEQARRTWWMVQRWQQHHHRMPAHVDECQLCVEAMQEVAAAISGTRDFRAFKGRQRPHGPGNKRKQWLRNRSRLARREGQREEGPREDEGHDQGEGEGDSGGEEDGEEVQTQGTDGALERKPGVRTVHITVEEESPGHVLFEFVGSGFMFQMCRVLASVLVEVGVGRLMREDVLAQMERAEPFPLYPAPANALVLEEVLY